MSNEKRPGVSAGPLPITEMFTTDAPERSDGAESTSPFAAIHDAPAPFADTDAQRYITERVVYDPATGCWLWSRGLLTTGYGSAKRDGRSRGAHRVAFELYRGPVPDGLVLDHLCQVRCCVNPAHLEVVTNRENVRRGLRSDTATHCSRGHSWAEHERRHRNGRRYCRACHREADRRYRRGETTQRTRVDDTACRHGHELSPENTYLHPDGTSRCRTCMCDNTSRHSTAVRDEMLAYRTARFAALGLDESGKPVDAGDEERAS